MLQNVLFFVGLAPLFFNLVKDVIDNRTIDALKNAGMNYAAITVWIGLQQNIFVYSFFILGLVILFSRFPKAFGEGDFTALFWIFPILWLLNVWAIPIFLCLFIFGLAVTSNFSRPPYAGYIPMFVSYFITGMLFVLRIV